MARSRSEVIHILEDFRDSPQEVLRIPFRVPDHYANINSAYTTWKQGARRIKFNVLVRTYRGVVYVIKLDPDTPQNKSVPKLCSNCIHGLEDGFYNPEDWTCKDCVGANKWRAKL